MKKDKLFELKIDEEDDISGIESISLVDEPAIMVNWIAFHKEKFSNERVSIDFDDTLTTERGQKLAKKLISEGKTVYIITRRHQADLKQVYDLADELGILHSRIFATNGKFKWEKIKELGIQRHYDNNIQEIEKIKQNVPDVEAIKFDYDVSGISGYEDPGITGKTKNKFEYLSENFKTYSDYPDSVKNNAKAVLKWVEENGWGSCGTDVGKQRANQLASGEALSEDTIRRMYSYLSRHSVDLDSSKGYGDGCGKLMYDAWGGMSALSWSESKINAIEKEKMSAQHFKIDNEEKRIILGPAMIPNQKIFRKDKNGNPYYVFFSPETIRMIAEKYMKNKFIDNNDQMHDGKVINDLYVIESWIKEDESDKSVKYGFENLPVGTWFVSMKVKNEDIWSKVKNKELNGFSVSGFFEEIEAFNKEEMFLYQLSEILKDIED